MCEKERCCICIVFSLFLIVTLVANAFLLVFTRIFPFQFPDNSIFKNDQILIERNNSFEYDNISKYEKLQELYQNYSNNIYYKRKYDFSKSYNIGIIPIFFILTIVFSVNLICCKNDKVLFIIIRIIFIILQLATLLNLLLFSEKERKKLPELENFSEGEGEISKILKNYNNYRKIFSKEIHIAIYAVLGLEFFIYFMISIFKKGDNTQSRKEKFARTSLLLHSIFGLISVILFHLSPHIYYSCKNKYSDNFHSNEYRFKKNILTIEHYDYVDYPYLEEIYHIYYKNISKEEVKLELKAKHIGTLYFYLSVAAMPALSLISFILLIFFKCKEKFHAGFIVFEIISILLKIYIIFWPFIWIKNKYRTNIVNTNFEIKHIIDDYINYAKCRNTFPIIIIIECVYILFEIIIFCVTFAENSKSPIQNTISRNIIPQTQIQPQPQSNSETERIIFVERERVITKFVQLEPVFVELKFRDNKGKIYKLEKVDNQRVFDDVLNAFLGKFDIPRKNVKSVKFGDKNLYRNNQGYSGTIEELNLNNNSDFIDIILEEPKPSKSRLAPFPKLHFCIINLSNKKEEFDKKLEDTFEDFLEKIKINNKEILDNNTYFETIYFYDRGLKKNITKKDYKKNIKELKIPENATIYLFYNSKDNTEIKIVFIWVNQNNKKFVYPALKKNNFHSLALSFENYLKKNQTELMENNIITRFYYNIPGINNRSNINNTPTIYSNMSAKMETLSNIISNDYIIESQIQNKLCFYALDLLNINDNTEICFETGIYSTNESQKMILKNSRAFASEFLEQQNKVIVFKSALTGNRKFAIEANINEKFLEILPKLERDYPDIFKKKKIRSALLYGENLMNEEKKQSKIKDLNIGDKIEDEILLVFEENTPNSERTPNSDK